MLDLDLDDLRQRFGRDGFVRIPRLLDDDQLEELTATYMRFVRREIAVPGRDYCDMAGDYGAAPEDFDVVNVMLPRRHHPAFAENAWEKLAAEVAAGLLPDATTLDYDQLVAKPPGHPKAIFHWHQDLAYWPATPSPETVTLWLALDDVDASNGCLRFVKGSHLEPELRPHRPLTGDRDESHTLVADVDDGDPAIVEAPLRRGRRSRSESGSSMAPEGTSAIAGDAPMSSPSGPPRRWRPSAPWGSPTATRTTWTSCAA